MVLFRLLPHQSLFESCRRGLPWRPAEVTRHSKRPSAEARIILLRVRACQTGSGISGDVRFASSGASPTSNARELQRVSLFSRSGCVSNRRTSSPPSRPETCSAATFCAPLPRRTYPVNVACAGWGFSSADFCKKQDDLKAAPLSDLEESPCIDRDWQASCKLAEIRFCHCVSGRFQRRQAPVPCRSGGEIF
jgi:hypothetical protein